eukprot:TRINITY_DN1968_c2_g1_i1.p1 TRINITY_DN1968_c2_g1~~TRINITY_DN1968_c2_g1_i1.p1  ORF type:complete len:701 (-),score=283.59 TRINITY_DN1968_c2_g1_i1:77-2092(-)
MKTTKNNAESRTHILLNQLSNSTLSNNNNNNNNISNFEKYNFCPNQLRKTLDNHIEQREQIYELFKQPIFDLNKQIGLSLPEFRNLTHQRCATIAKSGKVDINLFVTEPLKFAALLEALSYHDCSLQVRFGVHAGLFSASVLKMGTKYHQKYIQDINDFKIKGAFAMTELGHGSNIQQLETKAVWVNATDSKPGHFILNTPTETAQKFLVGGLGEYGNMTIVFSQLEINGKSYGVHPFLVQIRDDAGNPITGVRIADVGPKQGANGIDNGRLWFDNLVIPRESLLNNFNDVAPDGTYSSPLSSPAERFLANMGALLGARINVGISANNIAKLGVLIALRYGSTRKQFGQKGKPETTLIDYASYQSRMFPLIATCFALNFFGNIAKLEAYSSQVNLKEQHTYAACIKVYASFFQNDALQISRECCGGQGYLACNRIGVLRADWDMHVTVDGANHVLYQQVAKSFLDTIKDQLIDLETFEQNLNESKAQLKNKYELQGHQVLFDENFSAEALRLRRDSLAYQLASSLMQQTSNGVHPTNAWDNLMDLVWKLSNAFTEHLIYIKFDEGQFDQRTVSLPILKILKRLFILNCLDRDIEAVLVNLNLPNSIIIDVRCEMREIFKIIRPFALQLVASFGIPEHMIAAPIASDWQSYWAYSNNKNNQTHLCSATKSNQ